MDEKNDKYIRPCEISRITGLSSTTVWRLEKDGQFPKRRKLSKGTVGWRFSEVLRWIEDREIAGGME